MIHGLWLDQQLSILRHTDEYFRHLRKKDQPIIVDEDGIFGHL